MGSSLSWPGSPFQSPDCLPGLSNQYFPDPLDSLFLSAHPCNVTGLHLPCCPSPCSFKAISWLLPLSFCSSQSLLCPKEPNCCLPFPKGRTLLSPTSRGEVSFSPPAWQILSWSEVIQGASHGVCVYMKSLKNIVPKMRLIVQRKPYRGESWAGPS